MKMLQEDVALQPVQTETIKREIAAQISKIIFAKATDFDAFESKLKVKRYKSRQINKKTGKEYKYDKSMAYVIIPEFLTKLLSLKKGDVLEIAFRKIKDADENQPYWKKYAKKRKQNLAKSDN